MPPNGPAAANLTASSAESPWDHEVSLVSKERRHAPRVSRAPAAQRTRVGDVTIVLQPIVDIWSGSVVAAEALARFPAQPDRSPAEVFALAHDAGAGAELEAECLKLALRRRDEMPGGVLLCVNVSPDALADSAVQHALPEDLTGIVLELTEQAANQPGVAQRSLLSLRNRGALLAIDDASTGYAGLLRLARLRPDIVKLDHGLVAGARDRVEQSAVIEALVTLSRRIGARVLGEGVEALDDFTHLAALDVDYAQGWVIAPPAPMLPAVSPAAVEACRAARAELLSATATRSVLTPAASISSVTAALTGSARRGDLHDALRAAALSLGVDEVALSTLSDPDRLQEVSSTSAVPDRERYRLSEYPATRHALSSGSMIEAHVDDERTDPAERALLARDGFASLLLTPVTIGDTQLGVLEFRHRSHRLWTTRDISHARTLAEHLAHALNRLGAP
jgi:EAL domain-containing protein (putative c-di-GMP-specific phosphodiesterase class I)